MVIASPAASDANPVDGPLAGVRVVELGVWVAGPAAAGIMADWGADVIKVEPDACDPQRAVFGSVGPEFLTTALRSTGVVDDSSSVAEVEHDRIGNGVGFLCEPRRA